MTCNKPNWRLLKECAEKLTEQGKVPFTRKQLIECVLKEHPERETGSLNPMIQGITANLKGGAPGGIGKNILVSTARGLFELYDSGKHDNLPSAPPLTEREHGRTERLSSDDARDEQEHTKPKSTEDEIRDLLMQILYHKLGREGSWNGVGKTAMFDLRGDFPGYQCFAERGLSYQLPTGTSMTHRSDILISNEGIGKHISIEIKHRSAVTDQFKCRSYDMLHMKSTTGENLLGVMVYVKSSTGISIERATSICYPFDHFIGLHADAMHFPGAWDGLVAALRGFME